MDTIKSQLETLSETALKEVNYTSWLFKLNLMLKAKGSYMVAKGLEVKPEGDENNAAVKAWIKKDIEAQAMIGLNVDSNIARKILNCLTSKQMLDKLDMLYGRKSELTIEGLQRRFFSFKYDTDLSATENCMQIKQLAEDLEAEGENVKESWILTRIIGMLPPKLHHFRTAWDNISTQEKKFNLLVEKLKLEEDRLNDSAIQSHNALIVRPGKSTSSSNPNQNNITSVECFKCGKRGHVKKDCHNKPCSKYLNYCKTKYPCNNCKRTGHFAKDCPERSANKCTEKTNKCQSRNSNRRALATIGLSTIEIIELKSQRNCAELWFQDCAATQHMSFRRDWMENFKKLEVPTSVVIGNATKLEGMGTGDVKLEAYNGRNLEKVMLKDVLLVPDLTFNLFSVTQLLDKGYKQEADACKSKFLTMVGGETVAMAKRKDNLFQMMFREAKGHKCLAVTSLKTWHKRMAHQNVSHVKTVLNRKKIKYLDDWGDHVCESCIYGKHHRISHRANPKTAKAVLDLIHVDLGEMNATSLGGAKYFLLFRDDFSHYRTVFFLKTKDEAIDKLNDFINLVQNQFNKKIKCLMSDNGTEIKNAKTKSLLEGLGIFHMKSNTYTPEQNGRIERDMRTVVELTRTLLHEKNFNENLWAEALNYVIFTLNQTGTSSLKEVSPADLWFGRKMKINRLRSFGCPCYVLIPDNKRKKLDRKSKKGFFVGYDIDSPCFRVYITEDRDVTCSDNVIFDVETERMKANSSLQHSITESDDLDEDDIEEVNDSETHEEPEDPHTHSLRENTLGIQKQSFTEMRKTDDETRRLRDRSKLSQPVRYSDYIMDFLRKENYANLAVVEAAAKKQADYLLERIFDLRQEQDEVRYTNGLILSSKCLAIRAAQVSKKDLIKKEFEEKNNRLDQMIEDQRKIAIQKEDYERNKDHKKIKNLSKEVMEQIAEKAKEELVEGERIEEAKTQALLEQQVQEEQIGKPPPVVLDYEKKPQQEVEPEASKDSSEDERPRVVPKHTGRKKHRKHNSLDISIEDDSDDDEELLIKVKMKS